jgi:hypothetical protein
VIGPLAPSDAALLIGAIDVPLAARDGPPPASDV